MSDFGLIRKQSSDEVKHESTEDIKNPGMYARGGKLDRPRCFGGMPRVSTAKGGGRGESCGSHGLSRLAVRNPSTE